MNNFSRYESYKDSGVDWLGEIPEHWEILPAKRFHNVKKEVNSRGQCQNILSLTLRGVVNNDPDSPEGLVPKDYRTYQLFEKDNLVFKLIDLENFKTSRVGIVHEKGIMSSAYIRLEIGKNNVERFAYYYYFSLYLNGVYNNVGAGVRSTLNPTDLLELPFIKPQKQEQSNIVNFLDRKTAQIDQAISQKVRQIELLQERRQILIQKSLMEGLNPNVKKKHSGVDWLGEIPEHWELKRLKYLLNERNERSETGDEPLFMVSQTYGLVVRADYHEKADVAQSSIGNKKVHKNDLVFNKLKAHLGVFYKSNIDFVGIVSPDYAVYYPIGDIEDLKFLELLFRHPAYLAQFISKATGIVEGLIRLYTSDLFSLEVAVPPLEEQKKILEYCENISAKNETAISCKQKEIEKLKEYKAVLINSAVTGKIKVN